MVKTNIHEYRTRVTRFNPLWVSDAGLTNGSVLKSMTRTDSILVSFKVWSLESGDCQLTLPGDHSSGVSCVTFNDQWVISGDNCGEIKVRVLNSGVHHK